VSVSVSVSLSVTASCVCDCDYVYVYVCVCVVDGVAHENLEEREAVRRDTPALKRDVNTTFKKRDAIILKQDTNSCLQPSSRYVST